MPKSICYCTEMQPKKGVIFFGCVFWMAIFTISFIEMRTDAIIVFIYAVIILLFI